MPNDLRSAVIKLAHAQTTLRKPLLAILKEAADGPPSSLTAWGASEDQSRYTWSDGKTTFSINRRDMRGITYYVLRVTSDEKFPDGDPILKKTFQHNGQKGRAKDWVEAAQGLYRMIQAAANGEGSVIFNTLRPVEL
jgi:hypothetical protein